MANPILLAGGFLNPVALRVAVSSNRIVVAQRDGKFITVDATTAQTTQLATMPGRVATFDLAADGKTAFVAVERDVWEADLSTPSTRRLVRGMALPRAILFEQTGGPLLVAKGNSPGRVFSINPSSSPLQATQIGRGLPGARAMVHNASSGTHHHCGAVRRRQPR